MIVTGSRVVRGQAHVRWSRRESWSWSRYQSREKTEICRIVELSCCSAIERRARPKHEWSVYVSLGGLFFFLFSFSDFFFWFKKNIDFFLTFFNFHRFFFTCVPFHFFFFAYVSFLIFWFFWGSSHSDKSKITRVTVGRYRPIDQSFRVCKVNLRANLKDVINSKTVTITEIQQVRKGRFSQELIILRSDSLKLRFFLTYAWFLRLRVRKQWYVHWKYEIKKQIRTHIWQNKRRDILSTQVFHDQKDDELFRSTSLFQIVSFQLLKHFLELNT